jgi:HEAT repeat protein
MPQPREAVIARLGAPGAAERRAAARALAGDAAAAASLAARLADETEPSVRKALFGALVEVGDALAAELIAPLLRAEDAALRGGAVEALKSLQSAAVEILDRLLDDPDPDTRILAVEVIRAWPSDLATPRLRHIFANDRHVNVCAASVDVATEVGTTALLVPLADLRARCAADSFLVFAIDVACDRIRQADTATDASPAAPDPDA